MPTNEKIQAIEEFKEKVQQNAIAVATQFIGINAAQAEDLRKKLRDQGVQLKVFKNTLVLRALAELGVPDAAQYVEGPTAWAFCEDAVSPSKVLLEINKENEKVDMRGGILDGAAVTREQLKALADMPPKEVLIAQTVSTVAAPLRNFVNVMNAPLRDYVNVMNAPLRDFMSVMAQIKHQKEQQEAA